MKICMKTFLKFLALLAVLTLLIPFMDNDPAYLPDRTFYLGNWLSQFTRNYTQTTKRGLLTTNKG